MLKNSKPIFIIGISALLIFCGFCGYKVHTLSAEQENVKADYSIIHNVSFGLLSVVQWRGQIVATVSYKIENFELNESQKEELQKEIENILHSLISKAIQLINKPKASLGSKIKKMVFKAFVDTVQLHKQVPAFAKEIISQIDKPSSRQTLKNITQEKLQQW